MSLLIKDDHLWTEDEVRYQLERGLDKEVEANRHNFKDHKPEQEKAELDADIVKEVKSLDDQQVSEALAQLGLSTDGEPKEQKFRLATYLQNQRDNGDS